MNSFSDLTETLDEASDDEIVLQLLERNTDRLNRSMRMDEHRALGIRTILLSSGALCFYGAFLELKKDNFEPLTLNLSSVSDFISIGGLSFATVGVVLFIISMAFSWRRPSPETQDSAFILERVVMKSSHQIDHKRTKARTRFALEIGTAAAEAVLKRYVKRHGEPRSNAMRDLE